MTPGAGESHQVSPAKNFSTLLLMHASVNDLRELMPVGEWNIGQGIRRGRDGKFFYDLRLEGFLPLGPNHPAALAADITGELAVSQSFTPQLCQHYPWLADLKWNVISTDSKCQGSPPLAHKLGWEFFDQPGFQEYCVTPLDENFALEISKEEMPPRFQNFHHGWLRVFLSEDMLAPRGRLSESRQWLQSEFRHEGWQGHIWRWKSNRPVRETQLELAKKGLAVSIENENILMSFPVSFFHEDAYAVAAMILPYQG